jgi:hypothetical protein
VIVEVVEVRPRGNDTFDVALFDSEPGDGAVFNVTLTATILLDFTKFQDWLASGEGKPVYDCGPGVRESLERWQPKIREWVDSRRQS